MEEYTRGFWTGGTLSLRKSGFIMSGRLMGTILIIFCRFLKMSDSSEGPILVHVVTQKGHGYAPAEAATDKYHGVSKFDIVTGLQSKPSTNIPSYTSVFAESLIKEAETDENIRLQPLRCRTEQD